jgi:hypothetical protein
VEQQVHIVNRRIVHQPLQLDALVHILCNLGFYQSAVNGNHASIGVFDLNAGGVDIERIGNHILIHNSVLLNLFLFSWASRLGFWSFNDTVSEMGFLELAKENK